MAKKIMVIDDEERVLQFLKRILTKHGYEVLTAMDGDSGLEAIHRERPDLLLIDILLPTKDGIAVCEALRADVEFRTLPIILMTGIYRDMGRKKMGVDINDFIKKPFELKEIVNKIRSLIG